MAARGNTDRRAQNFAGTILQSRKSRKRLGRNGLRGSIAHIGGIEPRKSCAAGSNSPDGYDDWRIVRLLRARRSARTAGGIATGKTSPKRRTNRREIRAGAFHGLVHGRSQWFTSSGSREKPCETDPIGSGFTRQRILRRSARLPLAKLRHHVHSERRGYAGKFNWLRADSRNCRAARIHDAEVPVFLTRRTLCFHPHAKGHARKRRRVRRRRSLCTLRFPIRWSVRPSGNLRMASDSICIAARSTSSSL